MKKLMLIAAILAMVIVVTAPALAQRGDRDRNHHHFFNRDGGGVTQESEQDADSGDVDQSFTVTGGGDNSNQCVGLQGVANTGNAQNQIGVIQYASDADDFEFDETGASIDVSPTNTTECNQQVNQAASASGK
jgi:hypothetical protein